MKEKYRILIPENPLFKNYEKEIKNLYEKNRLRICDDNDFNFIKNNTLFYLFLYEEKVLGGIYYYKNNDKLFLNACAKRGYFEEKLECLKQSLSWFCSDIYAIANNRASALCLLRCGFKRQKNDVYRYDQVQKGSETSGKEKDVF